MKKSVIHRKDSPERHHYVPGKKHRLPFKPELLYSGTLKKSPSWSDNSHSHDFCEILFITSGKGIIKAAGREYGVSSGDLIIYNAGCEHSEKCDASDPLEMNFFACRNIRIQGLKQNCILDGNSDCVIGTGVYSKIIGQYIEELIIETEKQQSYYEDIASAVLDIILLLVFRILSYGRENYIKLNDSYIQAKKFIDENYTENITLDDVCSPLYISKYYLSHLFKEISGVSVVRYIIGKRMEKAKSLLASTDKTISEIAALTGYVDSAYFIRVFKNTEKITPTGYRKNSKR